jgi:hypothetical protein
MCQHKDVYIQAMDIFGDTHPPIIFRIWAAAQAYLTTLGIEKNVNAVFPGRSADLQAAVNWHTIIDMMADVPLKLSLPPCLIESGTLTPDGRIVQVIPDLSGIFGPNRSDMYPGYPKNEDALTLQCATGATKKGTTPDVK